jgi:hypothetical protein|tara:strand:- start:36 stop:563 length:528 start_codon:yes stop_codon:yes gene_type:complete
MFLIDINFPQSIALQTEDQQLTNILCKSAALPGSNLGVIEVPFRGRTVKIAGDRTFDTWTATFFNDKDFKLRSFFEQWANSINTHEGNTSPLFTPNNSDGYMADLGVKQLEKDSSEEGAILRAYSLRYCFPTNVSQIDLAYDSNDQIEEFTVEWQYSYFTAEAGNRDGVSGLQVV